MIMVYELRRADCEIRYNHAIKIEDGITQRQNDIYSDLIKSFTSVEEALEELKNYKSSVSHYKGFGNLSYFEIEEYYIEEYDDDGEWVAGGDIWGFSQGLKDDIDKLKADGYIW